MSKNNLLAIVIAAISCTSPLAFAAHHPVTADEQLTIHDLTDDDVSLTFPNGECKRQVTKSHSDSNLAMKAIEDACGTRDHCLVNLYMNNDDDCGGDPNTTFQIDVKSGEINIPQIKDYKFIATPYSLTIAYPNLAKHSRT